MYRKLLDPTRKVVWSAIMLGKIVAVLIIHPAIGHQ